MNIKVIQLNCPRPSLDLSANCKVYVTKMSRIPSGFKHYGHLVIESSSVSRDISLLFCYPQHLVKEYVYKVSRDIGRVNSSSKINPPYFHRIYWTGRQAHIGQIAHIEKLKSPSYMYICSNNIASVSTSYSQWPK